MAPPGDADLSEGIVINDRSHLAVGHFYLPLSSHRASISHSVVVQLWHEVWPYCSFVEIGNATVKRLSQSVTCGGSGPKVSCSHRRRTALVLTQTSLDGLSYLQCGVVQCGIRRCNLVFMPRPGMGLAVSPPQLWNLGTVNQHLYQVFRSSYAIQFNAHISFICQTSG
jgi:hypothetical protein